MILNLYYAISDQIFVLSAEGGAIFVQGRTGMLNFYQEEVEGFGIA